MTVAVRPPVNTWLETEEIYLPRAKKTVLLRRIDPLDLFYEGLDAGRMQAAGNSLVQMSNSSPDADMPSIDFAPIRETLDIVCKLVFMEPEFVMTEAEVLDSERQVAAKWVPTSDKIFILNWVYAAEVGDQAETFPDEDAGGEAADVPPVDGSESAGTDAKRDAGDTTDTPDVDTSVRL